MAAYREYLIVYDATLVDGRSITGNMRLLTSEQLVHSELDTTEKIIIGKNKENGVEIAGKPIITNIIRFPI